MTSHDPRVVMIHLIAEMLFWPGFLLVFTRGFGTITLVRKSGRRFSVPSYLGYAIWTISFLLDFISHVAQGQVAVISLGAFLWNAWLWWKHRHDDDDDDDNAGPGRKPRKSFKDVVEDGQRRSRELVGRLKPAPGLRPVPNPV